MYKQYPGSDGAGLQLMSVCSTQNAFFTLFDSFIYHVTLVYHNKPPDCCALYHAW